MPTLTSDKKTIDLGEDEEFIVKDHRGFTVFKIDESGDWYVKGRSKKL